MQISIDSYYANFVAQDPYLSVAQGYVNCLLNELSMLPQIGSVQVFLIEYPTVLSESVYFIQNLVSYLQKITDPAILSSPSYKNLIYDLTQATSPSLIDAANNPDPKVLAGLLLSLKSSTSALSLDKLETDCYQFLKLKT
jgi:hypothetical protein